MSGKSQYRANFSIAVLFLALAAMLCGGCSAVGDFLNPVPPTLVATLSIEFPSTATVPLPDADLTGMPALPATQPAAEAQPAAEGQPAMDTPTPGPSRTPTFGPSSTATRVPTWTRIPTRTPTITFTPSPPEPPLNIVRPGLLSKVISPITTEMQIISGADGTVTMELVGEDGRVISRRVLDFGGPNKRYWTAPELPFEIGAAAETARLQISTRDAYGRVDRFFSVDLLLLQVGRNEINPPAVTQESYLIRAPEEEAEVSGGVLMIEALARPVNESPLIIELVDEAGTVISIKQVMVPPPTGALSHTPIQVEIPYRVSSPQPVRLVLRQEGSRIPGTVALSSQEITLLP